MEKLTTNDGGFNDSQSGTADGDGSAVVFWKSVAKYDLYLEFQVWISDSFWLSFPCFRWFRSEITEYPLLNTHSNRISQLLHDFKIFVSPLVNFHGHIWLPEGTQNSLGQSPGQNHGLKDNLFGSNQNPINHWTDKVTMHVSALHTTSIFFLQLATILLVGILVLAGHLYIYIYSYISPHWFPGSCVEAKSRETFGPDTMPYVMQEKLGQASQRDRPCLEIGRLGWNTGAKRTGNGGMWWLLIVIVDHSSRTFSTSKIRDDVLAAHLRNKKIDSTKQGSQTEDASVSMIHVWKKTPTKCKWEVHDFSWGYIMHSTDFCDHIATSKKIRTHWVQWNPTER